ncbi:hypothetical protein [Streptomyces mangrovisoli]|uniref:Uncharacterized protein n=1 Tax=Streptomyces mangrovisoli TaxID=1428628 RepID=A0A1J4P3W3_9ACTN|nr:hypothetical protein [Streptomyces mangrovisoli]OIJ68444.1 hypothetical protein WN71_008485 [Streptomyces mangrovisoli]
MTSTAIRPAPPAAEGSSPPACENRRLRLWERRVRTAGLPRFWAGRCTALSEPARRAAAIRHTAATFAALPTPYRLVLALLLRLFPVAVVLADPLAPLHGTPDRARLQRLADRLGTVPGCAELLKASSALALYGALDTPSPARRKAPG